MEMMAMADINDYLDGLDIKFSEQEKQLADILLKVGNTAVRTFVRIANICIVGNIAKC